jgi:copper chaperone
MTQVFEVENIKCGGCTRSIQQRLAQIEGVLTATADNQSGLVTVTFEPALVSSTTLVDTLSSMGYPLIGQNSLNRKARSFVSCAVGRLTD